MTQGHKSGGCSSVVIGGVAPVLLPICMSLRPCLLSVYVRMTSPNARQGMVRYGGHDSEGAVA